MSFASPRKTRSCFSRDLAGAITKSMGLLQISNLTYTHPLNLSQRRPAAAVHVITACTSQKRAEATAQNWPDHNFQRLFHQNRPSAYKRREAEAVSPIRPTELAPKPATTGDATGRTCGAGTHRRSGQSGQAEGRLDHNYYSIVVSGGVGGGGGEQRDCWQRKQSELHKRWRQRANDLIRAVSTISPRGRAWH